MGVVRLDGDELIFCSAFVVVVVVAICWYRRRRTTSIQIGLLNSVVEEVPDQFVVVNNTSESSCLQMRTGRFPVEP